jgi:rubrerythrin
MRQNEYRKQNEGKKIKWRRLPPPSEMKLGTRQFEDDIDEESQIIQCPSCGNWVEESEIDREICPYCPAEEDE